MTRNEVAALRALTMPTTAAAVQAWLEARGLWCKYDSIHAATGSDVDEIWLTPYIAVKRRVDTYVVEISTYWISSDDTKQRFLVVFDRAYKIASALNASVNGRGE